MINLMVNVQVQGQLSASLQFVDARGDTSGQNQGQQLRFGKIDELAPGEMISWYIQAKASEAGKANFKVQLPSDVTKRSVNEEEPTTLYSSFVEREMRRGASLSFVWELSQRQA